MGWLFSRIRFAFTVIRDTLAPPLTPPRNLRIALGNEASGSYPRPTARWDAPASWGDDDGGSQTREYIFGYRQLRNADGSAHTGTYQNWTGVGRTLAQMSHRNPAAPVGTVWECRVLAENKDGDRSDYATLTYHAVEQDGFLLLDHRFLRVNDGTNWRRLRLE